MTMSRIYQAVEKKPNHLEVGYGVSERADSFAAGEEAARQAVAGISGQPLSAVLVFSSVRYDLAALLAGIGGVVGDAPVMGATTAGEICNEPRRRGAVVVALASDSLSVRAGVGEGVSSDWRNAVEQALNAQGVQPHFQEDNADFRCDLKRRGKSVFSMLFSPGNTRYADSRSFEILEELKGRSSNNIPFFGASSADDWLMEQNHVLFGTKVFPDSLLVAVFETELRFGIAVGHGFSPSRRKAVATKVLGHRVVEFDGKDAARVYASMLGSDMESLAGKHVTLASGRPAGTPDLLDQYRINVASYFSPEGHVRFAQPIAEKSSVAIMDSSPDKLIEAGRETLKKALLKGDIRRPAAALVFSCALRTRILKDRVPEEIAGMRTFAPDIPLVGFYSFGEQGVNDNGVSLHANETIAILALGDELSVSAEVARENRRLLEKQRKNEKALRLQSEILSAIQDQVLIVSKDMKTIWSNKTAKDLYGDGPEMYEEPCYRFFEGKEAPCEDCPVMETIADGLPHQAVLESTDRQGNSAWRFHSSHPYLDEHGGVSGVIKVIADFTEKKRYEELVRAERDMGAAWSSAFAFDKRLEICLETAVRISSMDCGCLYLVDESDGALSLVVHRGISRDFVNEVAHYEGNSKDARLVQRGRPVYRSLDDPDWRLPENIAKEGVKAVAIIPVMFKGKAVACMNVGSRTSTEISEHAKVALERIAAYAGSFIVHEMEAEKTRQNRRDLDTLFNTIEDMLFIFDMDGLIVGCNRIVCERLGYAEKELVGKHILSVHPEDQREKAQGIMAQMLAGERDTCDVPMETRSGQLIPVESKLKIGRWKGRDAIFGISRDVGERKEMERRMHQIQKAESLSRMAGAVAHNFNNMLAVVIGNLELAANDLPNLIKVSEYISEADLASRRAAEMSGLLLAFLGQQRGKRIPVDLSEICRECLDRLRADIPKDVALDTSLLRSGPVVIADPAQMIQVLNALVTNAWEAMENSAGRVSVSVGTVKASEIQAVRLFPTDWKNSADIYACLTVSDTGCGMDAATVDRIFDPFFTDKFVGRGLGLAVALGIVKSFGGCIAVESRPLRGSEFRVVLPLSSASVERSKAVQREAGEPRAAGGVVLLVEDEAMVRSMAEAMLARFGFEVIAAGNGAEALAVFRDRHDQIRLVLCDLTMPDMGGWETLAAMRKVRPDIPAILASGYDEARAMAEDHSERPQAFLHKPYRREALKMALEKALGPLPVP